ncbi:MAG: AAA family ATPase [Propionibacteriaceae bacterium]|jgi:type II secretory pathway predicted ATPase ExeA|nr:AAA family ATPase [Propionibacteriaceae bacterium]
MLAELNPYRPGLNPPELAGRTAEIGYFQLLVDRAKAGGGVDRPVVFTGLHGMGKTALLNQLVQIADSAGWLHVELEGQVPTGPAAFRRQLGAELDAALVRFRMRHKLGRAVEQVRETVRRFAAVSESATADFVLMPAATGSLEVDLETLAQRLSDMVSPHKAAFVIFVDELQDMDPDVLSALLATQRRAQQRSWPFYLVATGAPTLPAILAKLRVAGGRLFRQQEIEPLSADAARTALEAPAERGGVEFTPAALSCLVEAGNGYPFFLQQLGKSAWDLAPSSPVELEPAFSAVQQGISELDAGFFSVWWELAAAAERRYASAMAAIAPRGGSAAVAKVAELMAVPLTRLSKTRASLIGKGIVYSPGRGQVAFTVPGMAAFVNRVYSFDGYAQNVRAIEAAAENRVPENRVPENPVPEPVPVSEPIPKVESELLPETVPTPGPVLLPEPTLLSGQASAAKHRYLPIAEPAPAPTSDFEPLPAEPISAPEQPQLPYQPIPEEDPHLTLPSPPGPAAPRRAEKHLHLPGRLGRE